MLSQGNPFDCSCGQKYFQDWVKHSKQIVSKVNLTCSSPASLQNLTIIAYQQPFIDCYLSGVITGTILCLSCVVLVRIAYRITTLYNMIKPRCHLEKLSTIFPDDDFHYDAMVIFNSKSTNDTRLVLEMLENLEGVDYHLQPI